MTPTITHIIKQSVLTFSYIVVCYHILKFVVIPVHSAVAKTGLKQLCSDARRKLRQGYHELRKGPTGTIGELIREQLDEFRVAQCEIGVKVIAHALGFGVLTSAIQGQTSLSSMDGSDTFSFGFSVCLYCVFLSVAVGCVKLTKLRMDVLYAGVTVMLCAHIVRMEDDPRFLKWLGARVIMRMALGLVYLDYVKWIPWNILVSIITVWRYPYNLCAVCGDDFVLSFLFLELAFCAVMSLGIFIVQGWVEGRFRLQMSAQNQKRAMQRLAVCQCDAVFWLTPDLSLNGPVPKLAHMLAMSNAPNHLDGNAFQDYFATDGDRERFHNFLVSSIASLEQEGPSALLHVDLRDATDRVFGVEMFHSWFVDDRDQIGHLIGISASRMHVEAHGAANEERPRGGEVHEPRGGGAPTTARAHQPGNEEGPRRPDVRGATRREEPIGAEEHAPHIAREKKGATVDPPANRRPSCQEGIAATAPDAMGQHDQRKNGDIVTRALMPVIPEGEALASSSCVLDVQTFQILGSTAGLATLVGPLVVATRAQDIVVNFREFASWMQHGVNSFLNSSQEYKPFSAKVRPCNTRIEVEYIAEAVVKAVRVNVTVSEMGVQLGEDWSDDEYEILCVLELKRMTVQKTDQERQIEAIINDIEASRCVSL